MGEHMGTSTSYYNKRKKITEKQKRRNEQAMKKLDEMNNLRKKK